MNTDRLPPHSEEAERCIIGCCLSSPAECLSEAQAVITIPEFFYDARFRLVWETMCAMELAEIDIITVMQKLKDAGNLEGVGGLVFLTDCQDAVPSTANLPSWLEIIQDKHGRRRVIQVATNAIADAYKFQGSCNEFLDVVERGILAIRPGQRQENDIKSLVREAVMRIEHKFTNPDTLIGLSTGLLDLDRKTDGMHKGEMIVIAGFPSTGKTALAVNIAVSNALAGVPAAIFSAEMQPVQLVVRSLCSNSEANYHRLNQGSLERMVIEAPKFARAPIYFEPSHGYTIGQVVAIARRMKQKHDIKIAVIDYIQMLQGTGDNREQQISNISKGIKGMAGELGIPVLALSQLTDDGKLRESRSIGQDADSVWMLKNDGEWLPHTQPIVLNVDKCRDGETGPVNLIFEKTCTKFRNAEKVAEEDKPRNR